MSHRSTGFELTLKRRFLAPRDAVFGAFVDPDEIAKWFGPEGFKVPSVVFVPHVGSRYRITLQPPEGERFHVAGSVCRAEPSQLLEFTFAYEEPSVDDVETRVSLSFTDLRADASEVGLTQGMFKTEERRALHERGWSDSLDKLARVVADRA
jgi:uncharacterized protein YndB with AHSA1/START domain